MSTRRMISLTSVLSLGLALATALPGCGGSTQEVDSTTGSVKLAPGTVELDKEYGPGGPPPAAKKP